MITFENTEEKIAEKAKLFKDVDMAVLADGIPKIRYSKIPKRQPAYESDHMVTIR